MTGRDVADAYPPRAGEIGQAVVLDVRSLASAHVVRHLLHAAQGRDPRHRRPRQCRPERAAARGRSARTPSGRATSTCRAWRSRGRRPLRPGGAALPMCRANGAAKDWCCRAASPTTSRCRISAAPACCRSFLDRRRERAMAGELGRQVRLKAARLSQLCRQLSGGNQQKVVFARAIAGRPSILLLDEPTRGVDVGAKFDIYSLIRELSAAGTSVLMVVLRSSRAARPVRPHPHHARRQAARDRACRRPEPGRSAASVLRRLTANSGARSLTDHALRRYGTLIGFLRVVLFFWISIPDTFMSARNWLNISQQISMLAVVAFTHDHRHGDGRFRPQRRLDGQPRRHRRRRSCSARAIRLRPASPPHCSSACSAACSTACWSASSASCPSSRRLER